MSEHITAILSRAGTNGPKYGVPTLIGKPQTGKTTFLKNQAQAAEAQLVMLNPALDLPEDLGGFPIFHSGNVHYSRPPMLPETDKPVWLIVDELDKPRRDVQVALLTLFAERRIRHTHLPDNWVVCAAMNEPRMDLEPALVERLLFIPFDQKPTFISKSLTRIPRRWLPDNARVKLPEREGSARGSAWRLDAWAETAEWRTPEVREIVIRGLLNEQAAAVALAEFSAIEPKQILDPIKWMRETPYTNLVPDLCITLCSLEPQAFGNTMLAWQERIDADKTGELQHLLDVFVESGTLAKTYPEADGLAAQVMLEQALTKTPATKTKGKK